LNGNEFSVTAATRTVTGRSDEKSWSEASVDYYAETISYSINVENNIKTVAGITPSTSTLRLVAYKDPAVGTWQVLRDPVRGTKFNQNDAMALTNQLAAVGAKSLQSLATAIAAAREAAFRQIQSELAAKGILAKSDSNSAVVISRNNNLAYYVKANQFNSLSLRQAVNFCGAVQALPYQHWRLPTQAELNIIFANGRAVDTPDGRVWGPMSQPTSVEVVFLSAMISGLAKSANGVWEEHQYNIATLQDMAFLPATMENVSWGVVVLSPNGYAQANYYNLGSRIDGVADVSLSPRDSQTGNIAPLSIVCVARATP
jgi:hypothetical protein